MKDKKIAIVADWLTTYGGAEKVVKSLHDIFPKAPIYTSQYCDKEIDWFNDCDIRTGWMNLFPAKLRKVLSVFRAIYFTNLDLSEYDVIISVTTAESKGVKTTSNQLHISYLQGPPTQYLWGMYDKYIENPGFGKLNSIVRFFFRLLIKPLRKLDYKYAQRPDFLLANSTYSAEEIKKYYHRESEVIFPPVEIDKFKLNKDKCDYFISTARQVNWKRLDLAIRACIATGEKFVLIGGGAEHGKLIELANKNQNIEFKPVIKSPAELSKIVSQAKGFIFPSLEPFGIAPIEALATGTPVLAFKKGGALDYIKSGENGLFFDEQSEESLILGIKEFNKIKFDANKVSLSARRFSEIEFKKRMAKIIDEKVSH